MAESSQQKGVHSSQPKHCLAYLQVLQGLLQGFFEGAWAPPVPALCTASTEARPQAQHLCGLQERPLQGPKEADWQVACTLAWPTSTRLRSVQ